MKRRRFVAASLAVPAALTAHAQTPPPTNEVYELRQYTFGTGTSPAGLETYLKDGLIPALNRLGVRHVGVFNEWGRPEPAKLYLLIPHASWDAYATATTQLAADPAHTQARSQYDALAPTKAPFARYTTTLMRAFDGMPTMSTPAKEGRIFELRTYEGYSDDAVRRKVKMFNVDEIAIFNKTGLHPVFFGEVVAGDKMPCLTYMLTFRDMAERDANWKQFGSHPDWKRVSQAPEYANTVSQITRVFLEPLPYSQV